MDDCIALLGRSGKQYGTVLIFKGTDINGVAGDPRLACQIGIIFRKTGQGGIPPG